MNNAQISCIYVLIDPRDGKVFYVGKAINHIKRLVQHIDKAREYLNEPPGDWEWREPTSKRIVDILKARWTPAIKVLEIVPESEWVKAEKKWMCNYIQAGLTLTNINIPYYARWPKERWPKGVRG